MKQTHLNLNALQYFVDAVEQGSLTLAAQKNYLTRPGVSQAIKRVEDVLGFNLIEHSKNKLELTDKGADFFERAKRGLGVFEDILSEKTPNTQPLRVACSATIAEFILIPTFYRQKMVSEHTQVRIGTTSKVRQLIEDGESNFGLVVDDGRNLKFESILLRSGKFVLLSKTGALTYPLITTEDRPEVANFWRCLRRSKVLAKPHVEIESWSIGKKMAMVTGGTCLVPDIIPYDSLKEVQNIKLKGECNIIAIYKDKNLLNKDERRLLDILIQNQKILVAKK